MLPRQDAEMDSIRPIRLFLIALLKLTTLNEEKELRQRIKKMF